MRVSGTRGCAARPRRRVARSRAQTAQRDTHLVESAVGSSRRLVGKAQEHFTELWIDHFRVNVCSVCV